MHRFLFAWAVAFGEGAFAAQKGNPLHSADCRQALGALQAQEAAAMASPQSGRPVEEGCERHTARVRLKTTRRRAASVCFGSRADAPPPAQRFAQPPVAVAPVELLPHPAAFAVVQSGTAVAEEARSATDRDGMRRWWLLDQRRFALAAGGALPARAARVVQRRAGSGVVLPIRGGDTTTGAGLPTHVR